MTYTIKVTKNRAKELWDQQFEPGSEYSTGYQQSLHKWHSLYEYEPLNENDRRDFIPWPPTWNDPYNQFEELAHAERYIDDARRHYRSIEDAHNYFDHCGAGVFCMELNREGSGLSSYEEWEFFIYNEFTICEIETNQVVKMIPSQEAEFLPDECTVSRCWCKNYDDADMVIKAEE